MQSIVITYLALQLTLLQQLPYISCQQYTFNTNPAVPSRFLVPGGFSVPVSNQPVQPQPKRVLVQSTPPQQQSPDDDLRHFRKPITRNRPAVGSPSHGFSLGQDSIFTDQTPRVPLVQENGPISQSESEDQTEETFSSPLSTFEPTPINTVPFRTFKPSTFQTRPTGKPSNLQPPSFGPSSTPQPFFRPNNINSLEEDEEEEEEDDRRNPEAVPSPNPSTAGTPVTPRRPVIENAVQQFQRKPTPIHRINSIQNKPIKIDAPQRQPQSSEFTDNKIVRQYEKVPAKTKFEKSEISGKRSKKPVAQVIRNYREPNADGSITWGFESDDGSYKEETIGQDCITRGKYGYIDPDGVRREYTYSQGLPCDKTKSEQEDEEKQSSGYIDYAHNKVVLPNGESVDMDSMVKNRQRKPAHLRVTRSKVVPSHVESDSTDTSITNKERQRKLQ